MTDEQNQQAEEDEEYRDYASPKPPFDSSYIRPSSVEDEITIREVLMQNVRCGASAKDVVTSLMALSRTLNAMGTIVTRRSSDKQLCMEATNAVAVAMNCELMLRSLTGLHFIENYSFIGEEGENVEED